MSGDLESGFDKLSNNLYLVAKILILVCFNKILDFFIFVCNGLRNVICIVITFCSTTWISFIDPYRELRKITEEKIKETKKKGDKSNMRNTLFLNKLLEKLDGDNI